MFTEKDLQAVEELIKNKKICKEFYLYWRDSVNTIGYTAKLLLMFSAIESLVNKNGKKDFEMMKEILGKELYDLLYKQSTGLRHRLSHGEYFHNQDGRINYFEQVHNKIISYFNSTILSTSLINEDVKHPQRHFFGNKSGNAFFIQKGEYDIFDFKSIMTDYNNGSFVEGSKYSILNDFGGSLRDAY